MAEKSAVRRPVKSLAGGVPPAHQRSLLYRILHWSPVPPLIAGAVGLAIVGVVSGNPVWLGATALLVVYALATVGLNFAQGGAGMFTMATAAFVGVGGYSTAYLTTVHHWTPIAAMAAGVVISLVVASLFALLTLRVGEIYLAIATLALVEIFGSLILAYSGLTGGENGIASIPPFSIFGFTASSVVKNAVFNIVILTILAIVAAVLLRARPGRSFRAIREDALAAAGSGVKVNRSLNLAFVLAAAYASIAGSLYAHTISLVDPTTFTLDFSVSTIAMLVIGGSGSVVGAIIGAAAPIIYAFRAPIERILEKRRAIERGDPMAAPHMVEPPG